MIFESHPWKQEIARHARLINNWRNRIDTQRGYFLVERSIFVSAFIVRKLVENNKISDKMRHYSINFSSFKPFRPLSDRLSGVLGVFDISKEYDLSTHAIGTASTVDLCSEIIHSYVFVPESDDNSTLERFYINSYREQDKRLLRIELNSYLLLLQKIANDSIVETQISKNRRGKFDVQLR